tara:strand:- start:147 stop:332 length:186 start_codon:yes stop_codon:yes gene_type:complete
MFFSVSQLWATTLPLMRMFSAFAPLILAANAWLDNANIPTNTIEIKNRMATSCHLRKKVSR